MSCSNVFLLETVIGMLKPAEDTAFSLTVQCIHKKIQLILGQTTFYTILHIQQTALCSVLNLLTEFFFLIPQYAFSILCSALLSNSCLILLHTCSALLSTIQCLSQLKAIIKNLVGLGEIISLQYALYCTRRRISVGLSACYVMGMAAEVRASRQQWLKLIKCSSTVNLRLAF